MSDEPSNMITLDQISNLPLHSNLDQICSPARSPDWEPLVAAQEWNNYRNKLYEAVGVAIQMVTCKLKFTYVSHFRFLERAH